MEEQQVVPIVVMEITTAGTTVMRSHVFVPRTKAQEVVAPTKRLEHRKSSNIYLFYHIIVVQSNCVDLITQRFFDIL